MTPLKSAVELAVAASKPYPNDSAAYRDARTALLAEEIELRRHIERVPAQRRALPSGGEARDYEFDDETEKTVRLANLFGNHDTLGTYFWMYGPERERPCPHGYARQRAMGPTLTPRRRTVQHRVGRVSIELNRSELPSSEARLDGGRKRGTGLNPQRRNS